MSGQLAMVEQSFAPAMVGSLGGTVPLARPAVAFGRFVLHTHERRLLDDGQAVELGSRAFDVLAMLVESGGALVTKDAILTRVWPDVAVEENNIQVQVSALRRVFGPDRDWIHTIPGRGYRFTAVAVPLADDEPQREDEAPPHRTAGKLSRLSILVLPLAARGDESGQGWFVDSITDSLTTDLARALPGSTVIAQTTADTYKRSGADIREIGRREGVRYVLEGSILFTDSRVRVNAQLIEADTGAHVWAERFDKTRGNVLQDQDEIVARLSRGVGLQMINAEARRAEQTDDERPEQSDALDFVLRGHAVARQKGMTRESSEAACALYKRALRLDPDNVEALAGIASVRVYQVVNGFLEAPGRTVRDEAGRDAVLAEADRELARARALAPEHPAVLRTRAVLLRARGLFEEALAAASAILTRDPTDLLGHRETGLNLLYLGRTEEAADWFRRADTLAPGDPMRWTWMQGLGRALIQLGREAEAVDALRLAIESNPNYAQYHALLAAALALSGDIEHARAEVAVFQRAEPGLCVETLAKRSAVPYEATDPVYRTRNERLLFGLRLASGSAAAGFQNGSTQLSCR